MRRLSLPLAGLMLSAITLSSLSTARADAFIPRRPLVVNPAASAHSAGESALSPEARSRLAEMASKPPLALSSRAHVSGGSAPAVSTALADLLPWPVGFARLVTPYEVGDVGSGGPPPPYSAPTFLVGDWLSTKLAYGFVNLTSTPPGFFDVAHVLDGVTIGTDGFGSFLGFEQFQRTGVETPLIRGGRHTLGVNVDPSNAVEEDLETNNEWASQWVWTPTQLSPGASTVRSHLPDPSGGADAVPGGLTAYNCDGVRTPDFVGDGIGFGGYWNAVAICPQAQGDDVDLSLYAPTTNPQNGFETPLASSKFAAGITDFLLVDADPGAGAGGTTGPRDVGGLRYAGSSSTTYALSTIPSAWVGVPSGVIANRTIGAGRLLALWEVPLDAGDHTIHLDNLSGDANLDMAVVLRTPATGGYYNLGDLGTYGQVSLAGGSGQGEQIEMTGQPGGYYALLVWKEGTADVNKAANFQIRIGSPAAGVTTDASERASRFAGASPNPVRERTVLSFALARASHVELAIHDVAGRRVASVANGAFDAGEHALTWDRRGDDGRTLPDGLYFARFTGGGVQRTSKLAVVN